MNEKHTGRILIIDDDVDYADGIAAVAESDGHEVAIANNKKEALLLLNEFKPTVAILDIKLGQVNGLDILEELNAKGITNDITFIIATAFTDVDSVVKALQRGASDFLQKPISPELLLATLSRSVERTVLKRTIADYNKHLEVEIAKKTVELHEAVEMYKTLARVAPVGIFRIDDNYDCEYINRTLKRMTGMTTNDTMKQGWLNFIYEDDRDGVLSEWKNIKKQRLDFNKECRILNENGDVVWVSIKASEINGGGKGYVGVVINIDKRKKLLPQLLKMRDDSKRRKDL